MLIHHSDFNFVLTKKIRLEESHRELAALRDQPPIAGERLAPGDGVRRLRQEWSYADGQQQEIRRAQAAQGKSSSRH